MAIAFGAATTEATNNNATSLTFTGPTVSGANTVGVVHVLFQSSFLGTGVTWGGVTMTLVDAETEPSLGVERLETYIIVNPSSGASIVVSRTVGVNAIGARALYYTGVNQSTTVDNHTVLAVGAGTTNLAITLNVIATGCWTILQSRSDAANQTAVSGVTLRDSYNQQGSWDSNAIVGPGNVTMTVTDGTAGAGDQWGVMFSIAPPQTVSTHLLGLLGVGT